MKITNFKPGQNVVLKTAAGDSVSGTITEVRRIGSRRTNKDGVTVSWMVAPGRTKSEHVLRPDFGRITPFGKSLFLAL